VVDVEECPLGAFEEDGLVAVDRLPDEERRIGDMSLKPSGVAEILLVHLLEIERELVVHLLELPVLVLQHNLEFLAEDLRIEEVLHADAEAGELVHVRRPDPAFGRADELLAEVTLEHRVHLAVVGHDDVRVPRDSDPRRVDASFSELVHFSEEDRRIDDGAVADDRGDLGIEHPGRDQTQSEAFTFDHDRVAGVVAALVPNDHVGVARVSIGDLPLSFIAPLGAKDHRRCHVVSSTGEP